MAIGDQNLKKINERKLVTACQKGDSLAQKELYDTYAPTMYAICCRYMKESNEAKDVLQEGFIRVFRALPRFEFKGSFEGWLKRIFVNTSIEILRKANRVGFTNLDEVSNLSMNAYQVEKITAGQIQELINKLPNGYKTVFNLYVIDGYSHKEIAEQLGVSENTSKSQLFKARQTLKVWLKHWFE